MGGQQKVALRTLTKQEEETLRERAKASSERVDVALKRYWRSLWMQLYQRRKTIWNEPGGCFSIGEAF